MFKLVLVLLRENNKLREKFKEFRKKGQIEIDDQISIMWSKFAIGVVGGVSLLSFVAGRLSR